jgi:hypothetical protein
MRPDPVYPSLADIAAAAIASGATQEQLSQIALEAQAAADGDPIQLQTLENFNDVYDDSAAPGYFYFLFNPSAMDDDLENGFYGSLGVAGGALALAGGLAAFPVISKGLSAFAATEFALPAFQFGGGGLALVGGGSTGGMTIIGGGTITGAEVMAGAGLGSITILFMTHEQISRIADHVVNDYPGRYPGQSTQQIQSRIQEILNDFAESHFGQAGRQIWRLGKDILIYDGKGSGTMFRPDIGPVAYMLKWLMREFGR